VSGSPLSKAPHDIVVTPGGARFFGRHFPCTIGRGGVSETKREGDGATPVGVHRIVGLLYRPDRMARPVDWAVPIRPGDLWCDDPRHEAYNHLVRLPFPASHERLRRADRLYDLVILTDWNWPYSVPGRGSAIFIHSWRRPGYPTEGCIALAPESLLWIAPRIRFETRLIVP
jgi:L,D-peptidoglycan transpeptidase YkuD (ErfK/YbiS/YcfS/YnhG family)